MSRLSKVILYVLSVTFRHKYFTGKYTTRRIHTKLHPGLKWHIFHILTSEDIDDFTDLKFLINCYFIRWCMIETSRVFLESLRQSSEIFGHLHVWKLSEIVWQRSRDLWTSFREFSEIFWKWSEIFQNFSRTPSSGCLHNKKNITCSSKTITCW